MASKHRVMMAFWQHLARRSLASAIVVAGAYHLGTKADSPGFHTSGDDLIDNDG
ncbi:hypothetical protein [Marinobacter gelidimuriae]|uniref:hypothetical protein n=1 Tax=Marinobacter gelidimuriae TaxID=2739064 RepID=UPI000368DD05|nr:hypothetical protein [Marinobacter gelidimuriae]